MSMLVANWKMNGTTAFAVDLCTALAKAWPAHVQGIIAPPAPHIKTCTTALQGSALQVAAQDCSAQDDGAYTSQISAGMLYDAGARHVILGHSECRSYLGHTSKMVQEKAEKALKAGLTPLICVGESQEERQQGRTLEVLKQQLQESLPPQSSFVVAYEPLWAIGTGLTPSFDEIATVHAFLRNTCPSQPLLYGGSVSASNAQDFAKIPHVNGFLVGGASLKAESFLEIARAL